MSVRVRPRRAAAVLTAAAIAAWAAPAGASVEDVVAAGPHGTASFAFTKDAGGVRQVRERSWSAATIPGFSQVISWADFDAGAQRIGVDAAGNALIAWLGSDGEEGAVWIRRRTLDGGLSPIQRLTPAGADPAHLEMAVEPDGDATVVFTRNYSGKRVVQSRRRSAGGTLGATKTLSGTLGFSQNAQVAVTPGGAATVAWLRADSEAIKYAQTRTVAPDGTLSPIQTLTPTNSIAGAPTVSVGDHGTAVFSWRGAGGALKSRARSSAGALSATQTVSGEFAAHIAAAGDRSGRAAFAWVSDINDRMLVLGRVRAPNGVLGPVFELGTGGHPRVALDPDGHATFAWVGTPDGTDIVQARRRTVTAALGPVREVSQAPDSAWDPRVVVDAAGTATIAFTLRGDRQGLHARSLTPSGTLAPLRDVDGP